MSKGSSMVTHRESTAERVFDFSRPIILFALSVGWVYSLVNAKRFASKSETSGIAEARAAITNARMR